MQAAAVGGKAAGQHHGTDDMDGDISSSEVDDDVWDMLPPLKSLGSSR
jgi:hypothetical protein